MLTHAQTWMNFAEAFAFVGNSLLSPMSQTGSMGLEPEFWRNFPTFDDAQVTDALESLATFAAEACERAEQGENVVQQTSVEYTKLFIGPPRPAAPPWETMHRGAGEATVGFGQATFEMQELLRAAGLEVSNENNQYADHIGIELLYASVLCERAAQVAEHDDAVCAPGDLALQLADYVQSHPLGWIGRLQAAVGEVAPNGYIAKLLALAHALLEKCATAPLG